METIELSRASEEFCTAVQDLPRRPVEAVKSGLHLELPIQSPLRITDERIGEEPDCYYRVTGIQGTPLWLWGPDLLRRGTPHTVPLYRLQGARS